MSESSTLNAPLTRRRARGGKAREPGKRHLPVARLALAGIVVLFAFVAGRVLLVDTPDGGRPSAEVAINTTHNANSVAGANSSSIEVITVGPEISPEEVNAALAEQEAAAAGHEPVAATPAAVVPDAYRAMPELLETSEFGPLPRMSATGETPFAAYSRPSVTAATAAGKPLIAIVVTGLGINLDGTLQAVEKLPDTVTLAFAPYGKSMERTVGAARSEGHEVFLEVPLEPFDYPDNDPGPDTLLGQAPRDNIDRLYRVMGKFGGYAGVINNMGARFTASSADFGPMMEELGARGLAYLDDASSNRSVAPQLAQANRVPFARASMVLDTNPARAPILASLVALEEKATRDGSAIGLITALPVSIDTVAEWAKGVESRGFLVVPASALMQN
jgi:polysaccharide deacetylase 2 family uncharacterized protein YibQ